MRVCDSVRAGFPSADPWPPPVTPESGCPSAQISPVNPPTRLPYVSRLWLPLWPLSPAPPPTLAQPRTTGRPLSPIAFLLDVGACHLHRRPIKRRHSANDASQSTCVYPSAHMVPIAVLVVFCPRRSSRVESLSDTVFPTPQL